MIQSWAGWDNICHMANIQTQAYVICYFHVNAVLPVTVATGVIGRTGQGEDRKKKCRDLFFYQMLQIVLQKDKNATTHKKIITGPNVSCKKTDHKLEAHQIVSLSSARSPVPRPHNSDKNTHLLPRLGGGRILKTNKQRIDLLRRIAEVLITSDPSPLLSESASRPSPSPSSIYDLTLILTRPFFF